ncbi:MAG: hypothetical protein LBV54_03850 [Puniceicoccales bacterium]|jgi:hypothetical protein|nr:hypothetical protein [Puniceicoccales bacterium]
MNFFLKIFKNTFLKSSVLAALFGAGATLALSPLLVKFVPDVVVVDGAEVSLSLPRDSSIYVGILGRESKAEDFTIEGDEKKIEKIHSVLRIEDAAGKHYFPLKIAVEAPQKVLIRAKDAPPETKLVTSKDFPLFEFLVLMLFVLMFLSWGVIYLVSGKRRPAEEPLPEEDVSEEDISEN